MFQADEVLQVLLNRYRYKPFAATTVDIRMADDGSTEAATTTTTTAGTAQQQQEAEQRERDRVNGSADSGGDDAANGTDPVMANIDMIKAHNSRPGRYALAPNRFVHVRPAEYFQ